MISPEAPAGGWAIQARFILWGLWLDILAMVEKKFFQTAIVTLWYEGTIVGFTRIAQPGA